MMWRDGLLKGLGRRALSLETPRGRAHYPQGLGQQNLCCFHRCVNQIILRRHTFCTCRVVWSEMANVGAINLEFTIILTGHGLDLRRELSVKKRIKSVVPIAWDVERTTWPLGTSVPVSRGNEVSQTPAGDGCGVVRRSASHPRSHAVAPTPRFRQRCAGSEAEQGWRAHVASGGLHSRPALPLTALASHVISASLCARDVHGPACTWVPSPVQASRDVASCKIPS